MNTALKYSIVAILFTQTVLLAGCMTQNARSNRVERRQDRMDDRAAGRQERMRIRAEHEDARSNAFFDAM